MLLTRPWRKESPYDHSGAQARWCNAILAMAVAFKYPDKVSVASVIIGLMTIYPVIMIDSIIQLKRSSMEER